MRKRPTLTVEVTKEDIENGVRGNAQACPIAQALIRQGHENVSVSMSCAYVDTNGERSCYLLPREARDFVDRYDSKIFVTPFKFTGTIYY